MFISYFRIFLHTDLKDLKDVGFADYAYHNVTSFANHSQYVEDLRITRHKDLKFKRFGFPA